MLAEEGQFPFEVSIAYKYQDICGGAIISTHAIVTAAHCINYIEPNDLQVFVGVHNFLIFPRGHIHEVATTKIHPEYEPTTRDYDVALVKLKEALELNTNVGIIPISSTSHVYYGGKLDRAVGRKRCTPANALGDFAVDLYDNDLPPSSLAVICAGIPAGLCIGDDAGSLIVDKELWGIVSMNFECDSKDKPLIMTNLAFVKSG
ncbi:anionic trypsin-2-like [Lucilia sericata]|uniref:anionic trypsin-2-like n=1 Tax=Lucilia sericata TaxID=13632 RepID=UPI0018A821CA|nr:anionic trypsin-2-like [Lucilia sericata]